MLYTILAGFGIGLLGSIHCVGMCGPIALSLPIHALSTPEQLFRIVLYNIGRAITYSLLGLMLGLLGNQFVLFGYQRWFSLSIGILILLFLLLPNAIPRFLPFLNQPLSRVKAGVSQLLARSYKSHSYLLIGMANGLLPCGLIFLALANALSLANPYYAALSMLMFGMGTMPLMILLMFMRNMITVSFRLKLQRWVPFFVASVAVLIILRGMDLDIPYLSPHLNTHSETIRCHKL